MLEDDGIDGTLIPIMRLFNPSAAINFGQNMDPLVTVTDDDSCAPNTCFHGYAFNINASPFDAGTLNLEPDPQVLDDSSGEPIGFQHALTISRPDPVDEEFRTRPWTVNIALDYCIADNQGDPDDNLDGPCEGATNIRQNGEAMFMASILMNPQ
jgi:hypothetical protein